MQISCKQQNGQREVRQGWCYSNQLFTIWFCWYEVPLKEVLFLLIQEWWVCKFGSHLFFSNLLHKMAKNHTTRLQRLAIWISWTYLYRIYFILNEPKSQSWLEWHRLLLIFRHCLICFTHVMSRNMRLSEPMELKGSFILKYVFKNVSIENKYVHWSDPHEFVEPMRWTMLLAALELGYSCAQNPVKTWREPWSTK